MNNGKVLEDNKNKSLYSTQEFKFICELIWGGVPVDRKWAENLSMFKEKATEILTKYPKLDVSFFEKDKKS